MLRLLGGIRCLNRRGGVENFQRLYGVHTPEDCAGVAEQSDEAQRKICVLGVPSDTRAGFRRGANHAPMAIRKWMNQGKAPV